MIRRKVGRKRGVGAQPPGANVEQTKHPSKNQGRFWRKSVGLQKSGLDRNSAYPRV